MKNGKDGQRGMGRLDYRRGKLRAGPERDRREKLGDRIRRKNPGKKNENSI